MPLPILLLQQLPMVDLPFSAHGSAILIFVAFAALAAAGLCASAAMRRRRAQREQVGDLQEVKVAVAATENAGNKGTGNTPPVWQRRILMGERCEMPKFSGQILYDERGRPVISPRAGVALQEKKPAAAVTTLKDLL